MNDDPIRQGRVIDVEPRRLNIRSKPAEMDSPWRRTKAAYFWILNHRSTTYRGTASPKAVAKRRAKNKIAKQSRKANR